jgi:hypothetical protein
MGVKEARDLPAIDARRCLLEPISRATLKILQRVPSKMFNFYLNDFHQRIYPLHAPIPEDREQRRGVLCLGGFWGWGRP